MGGKILERGRVEEVPMQAEISQKGPELVVQERMSQSKKVGWSTEEMKDKPSSSSEEDTGEMVEWRTMSEEEMDQCWNELAEKIEEEIPDMCKVEDSKTGAYRGPLLKWRRVRKAGIQRIQPAASAMHACMRIGRKEQR